MSRHLQGFWHLTVCTACCNEWMVHNSTQLTQTGTTDTKLHTLVNCCQAILLISDIFLVEMNAGCTMVHYTRHTTDTCTHWHKTANNPGIHWHELVWNSKQNWHTLGKTCTKQQTILALICKLLSRSCLPDSLHLPAHCTASCQVKCNLEILPQVFLEQVLLNFLNRFSWSAGCRADYLVLRVQNINKIHVMLVNSNRGLRRSAS